MEMRLIYVQSGAVPGMHWPLKHLSSSPHISQTPQDADFSFMKYDGNHFIISWPTSTISSCPCDKLKGQVEAMKWSISSCEGIYQQEQEFKYMSSQLVVI